ncbi:hypothetical protein EB077_11355, partial [bacterium]|nr:hypothetical protein [bacterium]
MNISLISLFLLFFNIILSYNVHYQGKAFYNFRIEQGKTTPKVYDIGMKYIPDYSDNKLLTFIANALPVFLPIVMLYNTPYSVKFYYILTYIFILRHIFLNLTILPKYKNCKDDSYTLENIILGHCYDKIFSGHFAIMVLLAIFLYKYNIYTNLWVLLSTLMAYAVL